MADVFLSYARADAATSVIIKDVLESLGLTVFYDSETIETGQEWPDALDSELREAKVIVGVWSKLSLDRKWVRIECNLGMERGILVPIQIEEISALDKPAAFSTVQFSSLVGWTGDTTEVEWLKALQAISRIIRDNKLISRMHDLNAQAGLGDKQELRISELESEVRYLRESILIEAHRLNRSNKIFASFLTLFLGPSVVGIAIAILVAILFVV